MKIEIIPAKKEAPKNIRVAAYARVSSDKDAAFHSLEAQAQYYENYVAKRPNMELVQIYSDDGISGTTIDRPEFQRMLKDCRDGKIDLVITKSITRFARNTVILLDTIRELKKLGINCYFEKENLYSISPDGELLITLLAAYAEEEARSASENQKWRIRKLFKEGKVPGGKMYGYRLENGVYKVFPKEAEIVKKIYESYLSGLGTGKIARRLNEAGIPSPFGRVWYPYPIRKILKNRTYTGNLLLQTTYHEDFRTKKKIENKGELPMYRVKSSHEAIIPEAIFEEVQLELARRRAKAMNLTMSKVDSAKQRRYTDEGLFNGLIVCGKCGKHFLKKNRAGSQHQKIPRWICKTYNEIGKVACPSQYIPDDILREHTLAVLKEQSLELMLDSSDELNREMILAVIDHITVSDHNQLVYHLNNGEEVQVSWRHKSRRDSWTPEMREKARKRTLELNKKKNERKE